MCLVRGTVKDGAGRSSIYPHLDGGQRGIGRTPRGIYCWVWGVPVPWKQADGVTPCRRHCSAVSLVPRAGSRHHRLLPASRSRRWRSSPPTSSTWWCSSSCPHGGGTRSGAAAVLQATARQLLPSWEPKVIVARFILPSWQCDAPPSWRPERGCLLL